MAENPRSEAYAKLIKAAEEQVRWLKVPETRVIGLAEVLGKAILDGLAEGMEWAVVQQALRAGEWRGHAHHALSLTEPDDPEPSKAEAEVEVEDFGEYFPVVWLSKAELLAACEDLGAEIEALDDVAMAYIVKRLGDALQEIYVQALPIILAQLLGKQ